MAWRIASLVFSKSCNFSAIVISAAYDGIDENNKNMGK
jgi:hypothetical protein